MADFDQFLIARKTSDARRRGATTEAYDAIRRREERRKMDIFGFLEENGIAYERCDHPAVFTCEEANRLVPPMEGAKTKNLFVREKNSLSSLIGLSSIVPTCLIQPVFLIPNAWRILRRRIIPLDNTIGCRYYFAMIKTFRCNETLKIFNGFFSSGFPRNIQKTALRKLSLIHAAASLDFLRVPPANRLEKLGGNRKGQWSIRINDQWRICFRWHEGHAYDVEIVDYH